MTSCLLLIRTGHRGVLESVGLLLLLFCGVIMEARPIHLSGPEVAKLDWNTRSLVTGDLNNDGLQDLALINNNRAKIELLYQQDPKNPQKTASRRVRKNRWEPILEDSRFRRESIINGSYLYALALGDLNGDETVDLIYTGSHDPLTVRYQDKDSFWNETWTYGELEPLQWTSTLLVWDVNLDQREDLLVLAKEKILVFYQTASGELSEPETIRIAGEKSIGLNVSDINGDQLPDIFYIVASDRRALRLRFQLRGGGFGPELALPLETATANLKFWELDSNGKRVFAHIQARSRLMEIFSIEEVEGGAQETFQPRSYMIGTTSRSPAIYAMGDFNNNDRQDLVVADPKGARVILYLQEPEGTFAEPVSFSSFSSISGLASGDFDGSGRDSIVVVSEREGIVGVSQLSQSGRFSFPDLLELKGEPVCATAGDLDGDHVFEILVVEKIERDYELSVYTALRGKSYSRGSSHSLSEIRRNPSALKLFDLNGDSRLDVVVLVPREASQFLVQEKGGEFSEVAVNSAIRKGLLTDLQLADLGAGDLNGDGVDELIIATEGFARSIRLNGEGNLEIIDQYNARQSADRIRGPIVYDLDRDGESDLLFYHQPAQSIQLLKRDASGVYRYDSSFEVGDIELVSNELVELGKENETHLMFFGKDRFWVVPLNGPRWQAEMISTYETELKEIKYTSLEIGDLNADGIKEVMAIDAKSHILEILREDPEEGWTSALHFTIFDEDLHFKGRRGAALEPRETVVADLNGDGKEDFAFLIHDRVLLYYQD